MVLASCPRHWDKNPIPSWLWLSPYIVTKSQVPITIFILAWVGVPCPLMDIVAWMCQHALTKSPFPVPSQDWENATSLL